MRVLIIDGSRLFMDALRRAVAEVRPDVEVSAYDPEQRGLPAAGHTWAAYDLLFLSSELPGGRSGLDWLTEHAGTPGLPPVVVLLPRPDTLLEGLARRAGAAAVLNKRRLRFAELSSALEQAGGDRCSPGFDEQTTEIDSEVLRQCLGGEPREVTQGYRFVRLIGQGAMTRVYLAEWVEDRATVVLKILDTSQADHPSLVERFAQEAELIARLDSPYVVRIHDHGFTNAYGFIAMEFFARGDLKQQIELGVTPYDALLYALNIAYGLRDIHAVGIVHRDLKPANIMFRADGSLALADFGISKRLGADQHLTGVGELLGTPHYMSPEQFQAGRADERSDLYALGVILHEMLTGERPFDGPSLPAIAYGHIRDEVPALPPAAAGFQSLLARLLAKDPAARYQSAADVVTELEILAPALRAGGVPHEAYTETVVLEEWEEETVILEGGVAQPIV